MYTLFPGRSEVPMWAKLTIGGLGVVFVGLIVAVLALVLRMSNAPAQPVMVVAPPVEPTPVQQAAVVTPPAAATEPTDPAAAEPKHSSKSRSKSKSSSSSSKTVASASSSHSAPPPPNRPKPKKPSNDELDKLLGL